MKKKKTAELQSLLAIENRTSNQKLQANTKLSKPLVKIVEVHSP